MKILLINQNFHPDISATGQYLTDLACELKALGHEVTVLCGRRSYLDHRQLYSKQESYKGILIHRIWSPVFTRTSPTKRVLEAFCYSISFFLNYLLIPKHEKVLVLTSPPLLHWYIVVANSLKRSTLFHWAMDINPEQAIRTGWFKAHGYLARTLTRINACMLNRFSTIIVLDRFMKDTIIRSGVPEKKICVCHLWPTIESGSKTGEPLPPLLEQLRHEQKCIIMYSGNHSICHPLRTLLEVAERLKEDSRFAFVFVGGGARVSEVEHFKTSHHLKNIFQLGYQPVSSLNQMLSMATLHVVTMGDRYVGLVHPSKIYNILACEKPVLYIGPRENPITEVVETPLSFRHGESQSIIRALLNFVQGKLSLSAPVRVEELQNGKQKLIDVLLKSSEL